MQRQIINIFFAYADDSDELLGIAKRELEIINRSLNGKAEFRIKEWITGTISSMGNPEENILEQMPIEHSNYFVSLFRFKYGSPTGNTNPDTGKAYRSGMEEEFFVAYRLWKKYNRPEIMVFRSTEDIPRKYASEYGSLKAMEDFFKEFSSGGKHPGLYKAYGTKEQFGEIFRQSILTHILKDSTKTPTSQSGFTNIFFDTDNQTRNAAKQHELQNTSILKLQANTGYSFLAPMGAHSNLISKGLDRGTKVRIIIQNPWSVNALLTLLRKDDFGREKDYNDYLKNQLPFNKLIEIYSASQWLNTRLSVCLKRYHLLKKSYGGLIELRLSNRDLSNSILLTDHYLFFEPYFGILKTDNKDISVFEVQIARESILYKDTDSYFENLWKTSYTYNFYKNNEPMFQEQLRNYFEK